MTWTGTFDFCDLTGGYVDSNFGSIDGTITYCTSPCNVGINEIEVASVQTLAYPNPFKDNTVIQLSKGDFASWHELCLIVFDQTGKAVQVDWELQSGEISIAACDLSAGIYFYQIKDGGMEQSSGVLIAR
jgi:hypothetical protein